MFSLCDRISLFCWHSFRTTNSLARSLFSFALALPNRSKFVCSRLLRAPSITALAVVWAHRPVGAKANREGNTAFGWAQTHTAHFLCVCIVTVCWMLFTLLYLIKHNGAKNWPFTLHSSSSIHTSTVVASLTVRIAEFAEAQTPAYSLWLWGVCGLYSGGSIQNSRDIVLVYFSVCTVLHCTAARWQMCVWLASVMTDWSCCCCFCPDQISLTTTF